jgi:hypothetical protein
MVSGLRLASYAASTAGTSAPAGGRPVPTACATKASRSAMASSMASLVPEPMEKCAVCAASPSSTRLRWCQRSQRTVGKLRHTDLFVSSLWPCSSGAKSRSQKATVSSSVAVSRPARRHTCSWHSTIQVERPASNG